jgi:DNA-binding GntR family transcriptional regulator
MAPIVRTVQAESRRASPRRSRTQETAPRVGVAELVRQLRERIASHAIAPNSRVREWDVATEFGVPRLLAREALDRLAQLGFVDRQPNRGVVVHRFRLEELVQLYDMREVNEGLCARLAARHVGPETWDGLIELFGEAMAKIVHDKQFDAYSSHYERLRKALVDAAASPPLAELLERLNDMTRIAGRRMLLVSERASRGASRSRRGSGRTASARDDPQRQGCGCPLPLFSLVTSMLVGLGRRYSRVRAGRSQRLRTTPERVSSWTVTTPFRTELTTVAAAARAPPFTEEPRVSEGTISAPPFRVESATRESRIEVDPLTVLRSIRLGPITLDAPFTVEPPRIRAGPDTTERPQTAESEET